MILVIDNYDSFTYNIVQSVGELKKDIIVHRNDKITLQGIAALNPTHIILSPGPCTPNEAGICLDLIKAYAGKIPILGICLGHQAIGQAFGGNVVLAPVPMHGKTSLISHDEKKIFKNVRNPCRATRYHSLIVERQSLPSCLAITAESGGLIMGVRHKKYSVEGVQFHPESFLTEDGKKILANFIGTK
ncbi:aminodeoxychorismate/anthranilate synthase component II [Candidatus Woesearchaeota archaeon]|nr:aminodeoxychorismate/anthranilate synthase component II [Candidatus Woesearchaeota archaeon]